MVTKSEFQFPKGRGLSVTGLISPLIRYEINRAVPFSVTCVDLARIAEKMHKHSNKDLSTQTKVRNVR